MYLIFSFAIIQIVQRSRDAFDRGITRPVDFREKQLKALLRLYEENSERIIEALGKDLRKSRMESSVMEVEFIKHDLNDTLNNFRDWAKPEKVGKYFKI